MSNIEQSILKTVAYYHCLDFPLTLFEIYKYVAQDGDSRAQPGEESDEAFSLGSVYAALSSSAALKQAIEQKNGFYFLKGGDALVERRIKREKISSQKWKKLRRIAPLLQAAPFLRMVLVSGSLAQNNCHSESDLDVVIVAKHGRIWTARFFITALTHARGIRRHGKKVKDRICLNHYITDASLRMSAHSMYRARIYAQLTLLFERERGLFRRFQKENFNALPFPCAENLRSVSLISLLTRCARLCEFLLNNSFGDRLEKRLGRLQGMKIQSNPKTHQPSAQIIVSTIQLRFHPDSPEKEILDKYDRILLKLGLPES